MFGAIFMTSAISGAGATAGVVASLCAATGAVTVTKATAKKVRSGASKIKGKFKRHKKENENIQQ